MRDKCPIAWVLLCFQSPSLTVRKKAKPKIAPYKGNVELIVDPDSHNGLLINDGGDVIGRHFRRHENWHKVEANPVNRAT